MDFSAPSSAFGTKQDKGEINTGYYFDPYKYQGITARVLRNFALNERTSIRLLAEPSLMYYSYSEDNFDGFTTGFNRAVPYDRIMLQPCPPTCLWISRERATASTCI